MPTNSLPAYSEMLEYVLDAGKECECCERSRFCRGIEPTPNGPKFPACSTTDFEDLLGRNQVRKVYMEDHGL